MTASEHPTLWAVVMAGGAGTRFWPLSRARRPKQLLPFAHGRSLLAATLDRLAPMIPPARTIVVTGRGVADAVRAELPDLPAENLLVEPIGRDTAPCVGLAAWWLARRHPGAVMIVVPADHVIPDAGALRRALAAAGATAVARGGLVTLGLRPTRPETGYGYIELDALVGEAGGLPVHRVARFVEKPARGAAETMIASGRFRWNSGMFAWTVEAIGAAIRKHVPELAEGLDAIFDAGYDDATSLAARYPSLPRVSIDFGVMEKAADVWIVPVEFAWSDVGSWIGLAEVVEAVGDNLTLGDVLTVDTHDAVIVSSGPLVATIGVSDLVVVATPDAVLVLPKTEVQRVKEVVDRLRAAGRDEVL